MKGAKNVSDFESLSTCTTVVVVRAVNWSTNAVKDNSAANGRINALNDNALDTWVPPIKHRHLLPRKMSCESKAWSRDHIESTVVLRA